MRGDLSSRISVGNAGEARRGPVDPRGCQYSLAAQIKFLVGTGCRGLKN